MPIEKSLSRRMVSKAELKSSKMRKEKIVGDLEECCSSTVERSETRLKLFKKIIVRKVEMDLRSDSFFKNLGEKWKIGYGTEDIEVIQICARFLEYWVTAVVLRGEGTIPVVREEWMMRVMRGERERE